MSHRDHSGSPQSLHRLGGASIRRFWSSILAAVRRAKSQAPSSHLPPIKSHHSHIPDSAFQILPPQLLGSLPSLHLLFQHLGPGLSTLSPPGWHPFPGSLVPGLWTSEWPSGSSTSFSNFMLHNSPTPITTSAKLVCFKALTHLASPGCAACGGPPPCAWNPPLPRPIHSSAHPLGPTSPQRGT